MSLPPDKAEARAQALIQILGFRGTYALGKHLAEKAVNALQQEHRLPLAILRPSLVSAVALEPYPGFAGGWGLMGTAVGSCLFKPGLEACERVLEAGSGSLSVLSALHHTRSHARPINQPLITGNMAGLVGACLGYMAGLYDDQPASVAADADHVWDVVPGESAGGLGGGWVKGVCMTRPLPLYPHSTTRQSSTKPHTHRRPGCPRHHRLGGCDGRHQSPLRPHRRRDRRRGHRRWQLSCRQAPPRGYSSRPGSAAWRGAPPRTPACAARARRHLHHLPAVHR